MNRFYILIISLLATNLFASTIENTASEEIKEFTSDQALTISQAAIGKTVGHYNFTSSTGEVISSKLFLGKPLIVSLIYTSCYNICPTTTKNLNRVILKAKDVLGEDAFNVITIGFDTHVDTPTAMGQFAELHSSEIDNSYFLSTDATTIKALARDLGFIYTPSPNGFDHMIQASILDENGAVYRQVYGLRPQTPHFVEPIKELVFGEKENVSLFSAISSKIKLFCTVYDPAQDKYYFNYSIFVGVFVGLVLGIYFFRLFLIEWRYTKIKEEEKNN
ncbi:MAG: SCO family protein [Gammaproteobacteria bacterium]|nr:SCO family protein [Gammaproteobacteria bacterium]